MRYDVLSRYVSAERFAEAVRVPRGIENRQLGATCREDESRPRRGHAGADFGLLLRTSQGLPKSEWTAQVAVKNKHLDAVRDDDLAEFVFGTQVEMRSPWFRAGPGPKLRYVGFTDA